MARNDIVSVDYTEVKEYDGDPRYWESGLYLKSRLGTYTIVSRSLDSEKKASVINIYSTGIVKCPEVYDFSGFHQVRRGMITLSSLRVK